MAFRCVCVCARPCLSWTLSFLYPNCSVFLCLMRVVGCLESPGLLVTLFTKHCLAVLVKIKRPALTFLLSSSVPPSAVIPIC